MPWWARGYVGWAAAAVGLSLAVGGLKPENVTRLLVLSFLGLQLLVLPRLPRGGSFILWGCALAAVVEGFHMISRPVFLCLTVQPGTPIPQALKLYLIDLAFTLPAYVLIFAVIERFARTYRYSPWGYTLVMGLAQALGDGGLVYFLAAPPMLFFLPYPMTNYHAVNVLPYLLAGKPGERTGPARFLAIPAVIATYWLCGAAIQWAGRALGYS